MANLSVIDELTMEAEAAQRDEGLKRRAAGAANISRKPIPETWEASGAEYGRVMAFNHALARVKIFAAGVSVCERGGGYLTADIIRADLDFIGG